MFRLRNLLLFISLLLTASCGSGDGGRTRIVFWHFWPKSVIQPILDDFEARYPDLRVESQQLTWQSGFEKIVLAFASNTTPDLCEIGSTWVAKFAAEGALGEIPETPDALVDEYFMAGPGIYRDRVYALPWLVGTRALFYNRTLFERAGLDPDVPPETWPELLAAATRIHNLSSDIYGFGTNAGERHVLYKKFMPFAWSNGGSILGDDGTTVVFDSNANVEALRFFLGLSEVSLVEKQAVLDQVFKEERIGMVISGSWNLKSIPEEAPGLEFGVGLVPRPATPGGRHVSFGGAEMLAIPARSKRREAALELARFLLEAEQGWRIAREVRSVWPSSRNASGSAPPLGSKMGVFFEQMETARTTPTHPAWVDLEDIIDTHLERALYGRSSPETALGDARAEMERVLLRTE